MNATLAELVGNLKTKGRIAADDVLMLRRAFYTPSLIATEDVEALADLDKAVADRGPEWGDFLAGAVVDYVVHQQEPADYVDGAKSTWVMGVFAGDLTRDASLEAVVRIVEAAITVPADLAAFILGKVKAAIAAEGCVDAASVALLRRLVFAGGGPGNVGVTRDEADTLFDINDACSGGANDETWPDFFAKAVADSLTAVSPFSVESRDDTARDDAWLAERESPVAFAASMARAPDLRGAMHDILHPFADEADEWRRPEAETDAAESAAAAITEEEAKWLLSRLGPGGLGEPEQRLIELLKSLSPPSLDRLSEVMSRAA
ncbi:MAG TPA: hypothetical protein VN814_08465 [Caulobacteraceae bacterium]|nr:hypothetical protein [Caulobacteraceae bacterium]